MYNRQENNGLKYMAARGIYLSHFSKCVCFRHNERELTCRGSSNVQGRRQKRDIDKSKSDNRLLFHNRLEFIERNYSATKTANTRHSRRSNNSTNIQTRISHRVMVFPLSKVHTGEDLMFMYADRSDLPITRGRLIQRDRRSKDCRSYA